MRLSFPPTSVSAELQQVHPAVDTQTPAPPELRSRQPLHDPAATRSPGDATAARAGARQTTSETMVRQLYRNHSSWGAQQFDKYTARTLSIPSAYFHPGANTQGNDKFLARLTSGHPFKWSAVSNPQNQPDIEIGIRFNSIQQGYEQVKHSQIHPDRDLESCGVTCLIDTPDGMHLLVSNESGHFRPSFADLAEERSAPNQAWRNIAALVEQRLHKSVTVKFEEFNGDPLTSLEHFQGTLSAATMDNRKAFLDESYPRLKESIANKLLRGEKIFCLEKMADRLAHASSAPDLPPHARIAVGQMTERLELALKQIKTRESKLSREWREKADRATSVVRRGIYTREARHHDRVKDLQQTLVNMKMNIAVGEPSYPATASPTTGKPGTDPQHLQDVDALKTDIDHLLALYWS